MKTRKFVELGNHVRAEIDRRQRVVSYKQELLARLCLSDLRNTRRVTQAALAERLGATQSGVSRLEHQTDLYVSTLRRYVEALGGRLEIYATFPDGRVPIGPRSSLPPLPDDDNVEEEAKPATR